VDRLVRAETPRAETPSTKGIVFVPVNKRLSFLGTHVVLPLAEMLPNDGRGVIDPTTLEARYRAALAGAAAGDTVTFVKSGDGSALLTIPGKDPWPIVDEKRVQIVERLYEAFQRGVPAMKTGDLLAGVTAGHPSQAFRDEWPSIQGVYLCSPRRGFWQLCA